MRKFFVNLICAFIPSKEKRDAFRKRQLKVVYPPLFSYFCFKRSAMYKNNHIEILPADFDSVSLKINGENNTVIIKKRPVGSGKINISVAADNATVIIGENVWVAKSLDIIIGQIHPNFGKINDTKLVIGDGTGFESASIVMFNAHSSIEIGERCMFAFNITVWNTDAHPIFDKETGTILNKVGTLKIGRHVWCGANATILKNTRIADGCIVGMGSVVSGKFDTPNAIIAGNPAKYVRYNISWDSNGSNGYIQNLPDTAQKNDIVEVMS